MTTHDIDIDIYSGTITKEQLAKTPSNVEIRRTKKLLKDFFVVANIPQFTTTKDLLCWRKQLIVSKLDSIA